MTKQYQDTGSNTTPTIANSPIVETAYSVESSDDGVFQVTAQTRYNAQGEPLTSTQKQLISELSETLENKVIVISERCLTSTQWTVYNEGTKRATCSTVPTSDTTAEIVAVDGFAISRKDNASITTTASRHYTADGMTMTQTDGRGNATTTVTDKAGRAITVTDAAGNTTATEYDAAHDQPSVITDAMGNTTCYRYDARARKVAEWGTAIQPAVFSYDDADRLTTLTTFRANTEIVNDDPSDRTDGDTTRRTYHDASGFETRKTYADGSHVDKSYDAYNRLSVETLARGITKTHSYEHARGLLLGTAYSDDTTARSYQYNHLGQLTQVVDDAGTRTIGYNTYDEQETDSLAAGGVTHLITETRDAMGRSAGYAYAKKGTVQQTVTTCYGSDGRINSAGFLHGGSEKQFGYSYLPGSNLLQTLTMPNNMTLTQSYEANRDLLIGMAYRRGNTGVAERAYTYDTLGRPLTRRPARKGATVNDTFAYSNRSELTEATVNGGAYSYDYDNIGNRKSAQEAAEEATAYTADALNQYTAIQQGTEEAFVPVYDADGNQTLVKTSTGIWSVVYNAENRPITFTNNESNTVIECAYDYMGRRATKKVTANGTVTLHQRYLCRGYLQIACCDLTRANHPCLWLITWDPTQPVATRPLAIQKSGTWYCYGWDLTKNICEVFGSNGYINIIYTYTPYGEVSSSGSTTQPLQWSSEFNDTELGLIYHNYRCYNPVYGSWQGRDFIPSTFFCNNLYAYVCNSPCRYLDILGMLSCSPLSAGGLSEPINVPSGKDVKTTIGIAERIIFTISDIVISELSSLDKKYALLTRAEGVGLVLACSSEVALGIIAIGAPEIASSVMGVIMTMHGADVISTGVKVIYAGELQSTGTHRTITDIAVAAGADQDTASTIANGVEIAIGGKAVFGTKMTNCTKMLHVEMTGVRYTVVTRWRDELSPDKWVMKGNPTVWNYLMSGKHQPGFSNQFAWPWQVHSYKVPCNTIQRSRGIYNTITKTSLGQRIYKP